MNYLLLKGNRLKKIEDSWIIEGEGGGRNISEVRKEVILNKYVDNYIYFFGRYYIILKLLLKLNILVTLGHFIEIFSQMYLLPIHKNL